MLLFACDAGGDGDWSRLRDTLARTPADPMALTLAAALERAPADDPREVADAGTQTDGLAALRTFDRARALAGADAWVGGELAYAGPITASACGPIADQGATLEAWLATCPSPPATPPERVVVPGLPALAAWVPAEGRLYLHPLLARAPALDVVAAPLIAAGSSCVDELADWCQTCPTGTEPGCEPLFGPGTEPVGCAALDAATPSPFPDQPPHWRTLYCAWRGVLTEPRVRFHLLEAGFPTFDYRCWDPSVIVRDLDTLLLAMPFNGYLGDCGTLLAKGLQAAEDEAELVLGAPWNVQTSPYSPWPLARCGAWLEHVACAACTPDPEGVCVGFFTNSSGAGDCFDLRRAESQGGGFAAMCAWEYNLSFIQRECANLYELCYDGRFYAPDAKSYENLIAAFPGFFDPHRRDRCIEQWQACYDQNPFHDVDLSRPIPTAPIDPPNDGSDDKCPL